MISDLIDVCRYVYSDKAADRKKAAVKLKDYLNQSSMKKALDKNYEQKLIEGKKAPIFTWENVFRAITKYVECETKDLRNANENVSKATKAKRESYKQEVSGLVKHVIRAADKGSPKLKGSSLFDHILEVLKDPYMCDAYGQDYCSILLKNVLSVRKYLVELDDKECHSMVFTFCKLFSDPDVNIDRLVLARIIHSLINNLTIQCDVKSKKIIAFFTEFFAKSKQQNRLIVQHLLAALNVFIKKIAPTSRIQVCKLGEDVLQNMLYIWHNLATDELKESLVEFLQTQMWCHHPRGDKQDSEAAYAIDWDKWMSHLRKLYELMYTEIQQTGTRNRSKDCILKPAFVELAVDVCQQLFSETSHCIDVTQLPSSLDTQSAGPSTKRRRLETGWEALRNFITSAGQSVKLVPWVQLVTGLLHKYAASLPRDEVLPYLTCLSHIITECKRADLMKHIQRCVRVFAANWTLAVASPSDPILEQSKPAWNKIWMATLRFVSLHHTEAEGYTLLSVMVEKHLVTPRRDIWTLFNPAVTQPITESVHFLTRLLTLCDFPETYVPNVLVSMEMTSSEPTKFPLRKQLIHWLLPAREDESEICRSSCTLDPDWLASALVTLTFRDMSSGAVFVSNEIVKNVSELERIYLESSLELGLPCEDVLCNGHNIGAVCDVVHVPVLLLDVQNVVKQNVQYLCSRSDEQLADGVEIVAFARVVAAMLNLILEHQILSAEAVTDCELYEQLVALLKKLSVVMTTHVKKEGICGCLPIIEGLGKLFSWSSVGHGTKTGENDKDSNSRAAVAGVMSSLCRAATPATLITLLLDMVNEKHLNRSASNTTTDSSLNTGSRSNRYRSRLIDFDNEDFDFDNMSNNNGAMAMDIDDDMPFDDNTESQDSDEAVTTNEECTSLLSSSLSENQYLRLATVGTLCSWCMQGGPQATVKLRLDVDIKHVRCKLVNLLHKDTFDANRIVDLKMMLVIIERLTDPHERVSAKDLVTMATAVRKCVRVHRKDQEICAVCIELLVQLVPHLSYRDNAASSQLMECRETVLHLASAFWNLETYTTCVRQKLAILLEKLVEYDPQCTWSRFQSQNDENSNSSGSQDARTGPSPAQRFISCLADDCLLVRRKVSTSIHKLFIDTQSDGRVSVDRDSQEEMFAQVFTELKELLELCKGIQASAERKADFCNSVDCSVLVTLAAVMCSSPVCEKAALSALLQFIHEKGLAVHKVAKVVKKVLTVLGYKDTQRYMGYHLPYLLHQWFSASLPVHKFPHRLLVCDDVAHFYRQHIDVIISELVNHRDMDSILAVASQLDVPHTDLLRDHIPRIVTHILPVFASGKKTSKASASYNLLVEQLSQEVIEKEIVNNLDEIVVNIFMSLYDPASDTVRIRDTNPPPSPPYYTTGEVSSTLDYITRSFSGSDKSLVEILSKTQDSIQKMLLKLSTCMWTSHLLVEKRRMLAIYQLFTLRLLKHFHTKLGGAWAYVLREIVTRLVYLIKDMTAGPIGNDTDSCYRETIASSAVLLLRETCRVAMDTCSKELLKYLGLITSNLVTTVQIPGIIGQQSLDLLTYLILEKGSDLRQGIAALDSFPDQPVFKDCRIMHRKLKYTAGGFTLKQEVEHFLNVSPDLTVDGVLRLEGLHYLYQQLSIGNNQLSTLAKDDTMCRLVCKLVELSKCGNQSVVQATGKCLGVLGPIDLRTISFPSPPTNASLQKALTCFQEMPSEHKYCQIFHKLNDYLTDRSIELVQCASTVLKELLSVKTGSEFAARYRAQLGDMEFLFHYLHPFRASKKRAVKIKVPSVNWERFEDGIDRELLWNPRNRCHADWVISLATTLIHSGAVRDEVLQLLAPVCEIKSEFCELILPYLIHDILVNGSDDHREVLSKQMTSFFLCHCGQSSGRTSRCQSLTTASLYTEDDYICMNVESVRRMLDIVQYLRQQPRPKQGRKEMTTWDNNFWLDLDYLHVAMAAQYCSAHFSTLLFTEIWCDVQRERSESNRNSQSQRSSQSLSQDTRIDTLSEASSSRSGVSVQDLLLEAYSWIGDPDGVYGCGAGRKADASSRICTYQQENKWDKAVVSCDIEMNEAEHSNPYDLLYALQSFGANHVLSTYLRGMLDQEGAHNLPSDTRELQFEAAWKIGQWSLDVPNKGTTRPGFHECMFKALKSVREDHASLADKTLNIARVSAVSRLEGCLDSTKRLYTVMADLQCVNIIASIADIVSRRADVTSIKLLDASIYADTGFNFTVPALNMQCTAINLLLEKHKGDPLVMKHYMNSMRQLAVAARKAGRHQISERAIATLKGLDISDLAMQIPCQIEEARLYWVRDEQNIAKHLIRVTLDKLRKLRGADRTAARFYPEALDIYGNWLAETRSENPNIIMEQYMEKTIQLFEELGDDDVNCMDAYLSLARYADAQYQNIVNYMQSSTYEAKQSLMITAQQEAVRLRELMGDTAKDRYVRTLEKQTIIDQHELECMEDDRRLFLLKAIHNYIKCLQSGDAHNLRVFRLTSLWFNNVANQDVNTLMQEGVSALKTYKWLPLMYQLAARMDVRGHKNAPFLDILNKLIFETAVSHPHHTLFCILALANANRDTEILQQGKTSKRKLSKTPADPVQQEGRIVAAKSMVEKLRADSGVGDIVRQMETLCDAYIQLANWNVQQYKTSTKPNPLPDALWISKIKDLRHVPIPTREIKVNHSGDYTSIAYISKFESTFKLAGGINLPKIISCLGSDGSKSRQLVKGNDDLRQDAVMQQVFDMVNNLLQKDSHTRKRQLQIRKYKVIPLSQRSGLLEWCEGTQPIGEYLIGNSGVKGAHTRYRPHDWPAFDCRKHMATASAENKHKAYLEICEKFRPVFRHFFLEKFYSPPLWFERRLAYTRSVATNSIVGYILGLGDRHPQNILIDCNSAELVHIDLGVAFEQGEILPTPETVPFRLTRDIEDAMGASGVEGVFRRCCEKTMDVMRNNQEALLTILEVLLHDPLHAWSISPAKAYALQQRRDRGDSNDTLDISSSNAAGDIMDATESSATSSSKNTQENVNKLAERVLLRLRQKLQGVEDGVQLSLSGQVNHLIQEARNTKNLARLFPGWQPFI